MASLAVSSSESAFWLVSLGGLVSFFSLHAAFSPTMALYARALDTPLEWSGVIIGAGSFLGIFIRVPAGALSTVVGRKKLLFLGTLVLAAAPLLPVLLPPSPITLFLTSLCYGSATVFMPAAMAYVNDLFPESDMARHVGYYTTASGVGRALGPVAAGWILRHFESPDHHEYVHVYLFSMLTGLAAVGIMALVPNLPTPPVDSAFRQAATDLKSALSDPRLIAAYATRMFQTLALGALTAFFPIFAKEAGKMEPDRIGLLLGTYNLVSVFGRPLTAHLSARSGRVPFMVGGMVLLAGLLVLVTLTVDFWFLLPLFAAMGACEAVCQIATIAYVSDVAGKKLFGAAVGILGSFFDAGISAGKILPGWFLPLFASPPTYSGGYTGAFGLISLAILGFAPLAARRLRRPAGSTH